MYRKFTVMDVSDKRIEFTVHPDEGDMVRHVVDEIDITMETEKHLHNLIIAAQRFMSGNSINRVEVEEVEE